MGMEGRVCLVTGANTGHGKAVALGLAKAGAEIVLGCRDAERAERARRDIVAASRNERVVVLLLDLSDSRSIREAAARFTAQRSALDVLVNNAAAWWSDRRVSPQGIELVWATNVLGPHLLTRLLLPSLRASGRGRVVSVSSTYASSLDLEDVEHARRPYRGDKAYEASKQANRMLTWALADRLRGEPVTANALSPGFMTTELGRNAPAGFKVMLWLTRPFQVSPERGADTATWLASSAEVEGVSNEFFVGRRPTPCEFRDGVACDRLWRICDEQLLTRCEVALHPGEIA
jgi:NAD(P)-dependent dehydrogenase (short-subunit alcohol dehydrogenase family)